MKHLRSLALLLPVFALQSCSLFNSTPNCNNNQVKESVEKLYASQVNPKPMTPMDQMYKKYSKNYDQANVMSQSTIGIELTRTQEINVEQLKNKPTKNDDDELKQATVERFEGAKYICEGTIRQDVSPDIVDGMSKVLGDHVEQMIQNNKLIIPVVYAVHHEDGSDNFDVEYSIKNPLILMQVMMLMQVSKDRDTTSNLSHDSSASESTNDE